MSFLIRLVVDEQWRWSKIFNACIMALILLNVITIILETVPEFAIYQPWFYQFEIFSVIIFTLEYLLRLKAAPLQADFANANSPRIAFLRSPLAVVDLIAILPFYLNFLFPMNTSMMRMLRLLRVLKILRHSSAVDLLITVIRKETSSFVSALSVMFLLIVAAASSMYWVENVAQPDNFRSIPDALWWATVTLTTVGYGDVYPITPIGKALGMVITVLGVGMAALPAGILASGFTHELNLRKERYKKEVKKALENDGMITDIERQKLEQSAKDLCILDGHAQDVIDNAEEEEAPAIPKNAKFCPYCGHKKATE